MFINYQNTVPIFNYFFFEMEFLRYIKSLHCHPYITKGSFRRQCNFFIKLKRDYDIVNVCNYCEK